MGVWSTNTELRARPNQAQKPAARGSHSRQNQETHMAEKLQLLSSAVHVYSTVHWAKERESREKPAPRPQLRSLPVPGEFQGSIKV